MSRDSRINRLLRWESGETPGPWSVTLFPTNKCNLPCKHCWLRWGDYDKTYETELPDDRLLALVDECADLGARDWTIVGGGDPMVRGELVISMCERIRERGMDGMLHTNGTLFKTSYLERLIEADWGRVAISLDGPTADSNNSVRGAGFDKAIKNVKALTELKKEKKVLRPGISIHSVITNVNYDKLNELLELADYLVCDTVNLTLLLVESEGCKPFALTDEQKVELQAYVHEAIPLADRLGIANNFGIFLRDEVIEDSTAMPHGNAARPETGMASSMCFEPFTSLTIQPNGSTGPCCVFWDEKANSIKDQSLEEVWLGPYFEGMRENFLNNRPMHYCSLCPSSLYAKIEETRATLVDRPTNFPQRVGRLVVRGATSLRDDGLRETARRGLAWAQRLSDRT